MGVLLSALDKAGKRTRAGVDLSPDRHADLIANVDCEFRPVVRHRVKSLMQWADWHSDGREFPDRQLVCPDLKNRIPSEVDFDSRFEQPSLQPDRFNGVEDVTYVSRDADDGPSQFVGESMSTEGAPIYAYLHLPEYRVPTLLNLTDVLMG